MNNCPACSVKVDIKDTFEILADTDMDLVRQIRNDFENILKST